MIKENAHLIEENTMLSKAMINRESLMNDDVKVKYYTGLLLYKTINFYDFVYPSFKHYPQIALSLFSQFLMVLVRLRITMEVQHLSYHFGIYSSNTLLTFQKWIDVLYEPL